MSKLHPEKCLMLEEKYFKCQSGFPGVPQPQTTRDQPCPCVCTRGWVPRIPGRNLMNKAGRPEEPQK